MKKILIGTLVLTAISLGVSAQSTKKTQTTKSTHGKTVSGVAKTNTSTNTTSGTNHGSVVSEVATEEKVVVGTVKRKGVKPVTVSSTKTNNKTKTKNVAVKSKGKN